MVIFWGADMGPVGVFSIIEQSQVFGGLNKVLIDGIVGVATRTTINAGEFLFQKNDQADAVWGVLSGRIVVNARRDDENKIWFRIFETGDLFCEAAVYHGGRCRSDAVADQDSSLLRLDRNHFLNLFGACPDFNSRRLDHI